MLERDRKGSNRNQTHNLTGFNEKMMSLELFCFLHRSPDNRHKDVLSCCKWCMTLITYDDRIIDTKQMCFCGIMAGLFYNHGTIILLLYVLGLLLISISDKMLNGIYLFIYFLRLCLIFSPTTLWGAYELGNYVHDKSSGALQFDSHRTLWVNVLGSRYSTWKDCNTS